MPQPWWNLKKGKAFTGAPVVEAKNNLTAMEVIKEQRPSCPCISFLKKMKPQRFACVNIPALHRIVMKIIVNCMNRMKAHFFIKVSFFFNSKGFISMSSDKFHAVIVNFITNLK